MVYSSIGEVNQVCFGSGLEEEREMAKYYTVKQQDNGYYVDADGNHWPTFTGWECGHKHRTITAADKCRESLSGTTASINAVIVDQDGDIQNVM